VNEIASDVDSIIKIVTDIDTDVEAIEVTVTEINNTVNEIASDVDSIFKIVTDIASDEVKFFIYKALSEKKLPVVLCLPKSVIDGVNVEALVQEVRDTVEKAYENKLLKDSDDEKVKEKLDQAEDALAKKKYSEACKFAAKAWDLAFGDESSHDDDDDSYHQYQ